MQLARFLNKLFKTGGFVLIDANSNKYIIGSPEVDIMIGNNLPSQIKVKKRYNIKYDKYAIFLFHPVTTLNKEDIENQCRILLKVLTLSMKNYVVILPNNDTYSSIIFNKKDCYYCSNN